MFRLIALFAIAAVAVAEPEADADSQWAYAPYAATYGAHSVYGYPYNTYGMYNTYNRGAYRYPYSTFGYRQLFKREAESEPEADPQWLLHNGFVQHANGAQVPQDTPSVHAAKVQHLTAKANEYAMKGYIPHAATYAAPAVYRHPYNNYGMYNTYNYGVYRHPYTTSAYSHTPASTLRLFKREAESDSQYAYSHYPYSNAYNYPNYYNYNNVYRTAYPYSAYNTYANQYAVPRYFF